jgi:hypothetical protein
MLIPSQEKVDLTGSSGSGTQNHLGPTNHEKYNKSYLINAFG